ncbi:uncharacterized protein LOC127793083 [Diospyros lotus]|uniref:uncharacterized protein LOC127793083 n=1 Tax=Diospyros lotus TaxID=55363 RepID=UPI002253A3DF|nr:uncharacterized protein LOC127793083 [Diospyros lotus]
MATFRQNPWENNPKKMEGKSSGISYWAFLLSVFIYISIFYIFDLSPSSLFNTTKFWFLISNTLVLIIAADFGAFSSSRNYNIPDLYTSARTSSFPSFESQYREMTKPSIKVENSREEKGHQLHATPEKIKQVVVVVVNNSEATPENKIKKKVEEKVKPEITSKADHNAARHVRSLSEKAFPVAKKMENQIVLRRTESEKREENHEEEEENEFSAMSDEELNRRVEDFIRRSNMQIRLQAAARNHV